MGQEGQRVAGSLCGREARRRVRPGRGNLAGPVFKERGPCDYLRPQLLNGEAVWKAWFWTGGSGTRGL